MNDKCPKCGAEEVAGYRQEYSCGSFHADGDFYEASVGTCIERQRDSLLAENKALRAAQKTAWDEGWDDSRSGAIDGDRAWSRSEAKRIHDGQAFSPPSPANPTTLL